MFPLFVLASELSAAQTAQIDTVVERALAAQHVPGISIAIGRDDAIVYARGYGLRDVATKAPVEATTVFEIGSVTKQFTAAAVMQLVQAGRVRLDAPIATYLSDVPSGDRITVRELLTHTSGLPNYTDVPDFFTTVATRPATPSELLALVARKPLDFAPGTQWAYSNTNYAALGLLVAKVSGESYPRYVQRHVIDAAHLTTTQYSSAFLTGPRDALAYDDPHGVAERLGTSTNLDWAYAAGALWSDAPDLVRWQQALYGDRVVDAASLAAMTTPDVLPNGDSTHYGFGLEIGELDGLRTIFHNGGLPGYSSRVAYFPTEHLQIAVLGNEIFDPAPIVTGIVAALVPSVAARIAAEASATPPPDDPAMDALAKRLVEQAQRGSFDRSLFDATMNAALEPTIVRSVAAQLAPLGPPASVTRLSDRMIDGDQVIRYRIGFASAAWVESFSFDAQRKLASLFFKPDDAAPAVPVASPAPSSTARTAQLPRSDAELLALATSLVAQAQRGDIDRSLLDAQLGAAMTPSIERSVAAELARLGTPTAVTRLPDRTVAGRTVVLYRVAFPSAAWVETLVIDPDGKLAGLRFLPESALPPATAASAS